MGYDITTKFIIGMVDVSIRMRQAKRKDESLLILF
jgi:hypothetical protein